MRIRPDELFHQQILDLCLIGSGNGARIAQVTLLFSRFFGQDVTVISVFALDLSCAGERKTLLCSGIGFILGMSVIVSLVIHSPQRYEKFFILSFCRGEKVICMAVMGKNRDS